MNNHTNPLSVLWTGRANIYEYETETDQDTAQSTQIEVLVLEDEPCLVSYEEEQERVTEIIDGVPVINQRIILFTRPDLIIKPGSVIEVTQYGRTVKYKNSGVPVVYTNHQEILLELYEDYA